MLKTTPSTNNNISDILTVPPTSEKEIQLNTSFKITWTRGKQSLVSQTLAKNELEYLECYLTNAINISKTPTQFSRFFTEKINYSEELEKLKDNIANRRKAHLPCKIITNETFLASIFGYKIENLATPFSVSLKDLSNEELSKNMHALAELLLTTENKVEYCELLRKLNGYIHEETTRQLPQNSLSTPVPSNSSNTNPNTVKPNISPALSRPTFQFPHPLTKTQMTDYKRYVNNRLHTNIYKQILEQTNNNNNNDNKDSVKRLRTGNFEFPQPKK